MPIRTARLTVSTTPVVVTGEDDWKPDQRVALRPIGGDIYVGGSDVTTSIGFLVKDGETFDDTTEADGPMYAVAAASVTVHVYRGGVG